MERAKRKTEKGKKTKPDIVLSTNIGRWVDHGSNAMRVKKYVVRGLSRILQKPKRDNTSWITVIAHQIRELMLLKLTEPPSCIFFRRVKMDCRNAEEKQHQQFVETEVTR